uniref:Uncharacterized protein n=1 Tax=Glossina pallidipes TaxID=7398 RepID=A0A1A9ZSU1_GLOPL
MGASVELLPDEATPSAGAPDMNCSLVISAEPENATPSAITVPTFLPLERSSAGIGDSTFTNESQVSSSSLSLLGQAKSVAPWLQANGIQNGLIETTLYSSSSCILVIGSIFATRNIMNRLSVIVAIDERILEEARVKSLLPDDCE